MRRIIYSAGFFLVMLFLCTGFILSYQISRLRDRLYSLEESNAEAQQKVSALSDARKQNFVFEQYIDGELKQEVYRITAYNTDRVVLRRERTSAETKAALNASEFQLKLENGYVVVYKKGEDQVFEYTDIPFEALPKSLQSEILFGKTVENQDTLYEFLENYSS